MEPERPERVKEAKKNDILVIDDEIEESIKKEVLTLPQCVEMKVRDIRLKGDQAEKRNIVIFQNAQKPVEKVEGQKRPRAVKKAETKTTDIRKYLNNEKPIKINTMVFENSRNHRSKEECKEERYPVNTKTPNDFTEKASRNLEERTPSTEKRKLVSMPCRKEEAQENQGSRLVKVEERRRKEEAQKIKSIPVEL